MYPKAQEVETAYKNNRDNIPALKRELFRLLKEGKKENNLYVIGAVNYYQALISYRTGLRVNMLTYALKAVSIFDETQDYEMIAMSHNILGIAYVAQENYQMALSSYDVVFHTVKEHKVKRVPKEAVKNNIAECYYQMGDYKKSLNIISKCFNRTIKYAPEEYDSIAIYGINLADCYESVGEMEKANGYMDEVFILADKGVDTYEVHRDFEKILKMQFREGEYERAKRLIGILEDYAENSSHVLDKIIACRMRVEYLKARGRLEEAFKGYEELFRLYEQRTEEEKSMQLLIQDKITDTNKEIKRLVERVRKSEESAITDRMTAFYNKRGVEEKVPELCLKGGGMICVMDLDNFKLINDLYGHEMGDRVLIGFADIVRGKSRAGDILCRIGGDEFLVYFKSAMDERSAAVFAERLNVQLVEMCREFMGEEFSVPVGVSMGAVRIPEQGENYKKLFPLADKALYQVKQNGKHGYKMYDSKKAGESIGQKELESELLHMLTICGERSEARNAMWVGQEAFSWIYRFVERYERRHRNTFTGLLFSLSAEEIDEGEYMEAIYQFGCVLQNSLRKSDVILQHRANCFMVLLPELTMENTMRVIERVFDNWEQTEYHDRICIQYAAKEQLRGENL